MEPVSWSLERHRVPASEGSDFEFSAVKINIDVFHSYLRLAAIRSWTPRIPDFQSLTDSWRRNK